MTHYITYGKILFDRRCNHLSQKLDKHPTVYKVILVTLHIFRTAMLYTTPFIFFTTYLPLSLVYRVAVERSCPFRFTLSSIFGIISVFLAEKSPFGYIPLAGYLIMICYISHSDIENKIHSKCGR